MRLSTIRRILREDLARSGEVPKWIDALVGPLNDFIDQVGRALSGRLTFSDNFQGVEKSVVLPHNTAVTVSTGSNLRIKGLLPLDFAGEEVTSFQWARVTSSTISLKAQYATTTAEPKCVIFIFLE